MFSNIYKVFKVSWKKYIMYIINDIILFNVQGKMNSINILLFYCQIIQYDKLGLSRGKHVEPLT